MSGFKFYYSSATHKQKNLHFVDVNFYRGVNNVYQCEAFPAHAVMWVRFIC